MESPIMDRLRKLARQGDSSDPCNQEMSVGTLSWETSWQAQALTDVGRVVERLQQVIAARTGKL